MICNKCGKNNENGVHNCVYCGAPMPASSGFGGFGDILRYSGEPVATAAATATAAPSSAVSSETLRAVVAKSNRAARQAGSARTFALVAFMVTLVLFIISLIFNIIAISTANTYKNDLENVQEKVLKLEKDLEGGEDKTETDTETGTSTDDEAFSPGDGVTDVATDETAENTVTAETKCADCGTNAVETAGETCADCTLKKAVANRLIAKVEKTDADGFEDRLEEINKNIDVLNTGIEGYMAKKTSPNYGIETGGKSEKALNELAESIKALNENEPTDALVKDVYDKLEVFNERYSFKENFGDEKMIFEHKNDTAEEKEAESDSETAKKDDDGSN